MAAASSELNRPARSLWRYPPELLALFPGVSEDTIGSIRQDILERAAYFTRQATTAPRRFPAVPSRLVPLSESLPLVASLSPARYHRVFRQALEATREPGALSNADRTRFLTISFQRACQHNHVLYLHDLLARGEIDPVTIGSALHKAAENGHLDVVHALLAREGIPPVYIENALISAAAYGHRDVVRALLAREGITPAHIAQALRLAAQNGHLDVVTALSARGE